MTKDITCVPFFEANRVLTANRLNQIVDFSLFNIRQNRVLLHGIGILCGFEVSYDSVNHCIRISQGMGITSCGDIVNFDPCVGCENCNDPDCEKCQDCVLCYVQKDVILKKEDFLRGCDIENFPDDLTVCELFEGAGNDRTTLGDESEDFFANKVLVLLLQRCFNENAEGCVSDCDDTGLDQCFKLRKLLVTKGDYLVPSTNGGASGQIGKKLPLPSIKRLWYVAGEIPDTGNIIISGAGFYPSYAKNIGLGLGPTDPLNIIAEIRDAYTCAYEVYRTALGLELKVDMASCFGAIQTIADQFPIAPLPSLPPYPPLRHYQVQYFYDYLKDLIYAYEEFVDVACEAVGDLEVCPDPCQFPAFLILGNYDGTDLSCRNFFQKTCEVTCDYHTGQKARFLFNRMIKLLKAFYLSTDNLADVYDQTQITEDLTISTDLLSEVPIRITPSRNHNQNLSDKAIPYYLTPSFQIPISDSEMESVVLQDCWNYKKTLKCQQDHIPSYHNINWPLSLLCNIDTYDFYRIEGLVGHDLGYAVGEIERLRNAYNLGFDIKCIQLDGSADMVVLDHKEIAFGDLEFAYCTAYEDLFCKMCLIPLVQQEGDGEIDFMETDIQVIIDTLAVGENPIIPKSLSDFPWTQKNAGPAFDVKLKEILIAFIRCYIVGLTNEQKDVVQIGTNTKEELIEFIKNPETIPFQAPFDPPLTFNNDPNVLCCFLALINLIESFIQRIQDYRNAYLLDNFRREHPGLEHLAGVYRGGTFVILYDTFPADATVSNCLPVVVADFCLPYYCCDQGSSGGGQAPTRELLKPTLYMVDKICYTGANSPRWRIGMYPTDGELSISTVGMNNGELLDPLLEIEDDVYYLDPGYFASLEDQPADEVDALFGLNDQMKLLLSYTLSNGQSCDMVVQLCRLVPGFQRVEDTFTSLQFKRENLTARWEVHQQKGGSEGTGFELICVKEEEILVPPQGSENFSFEFGFADIVEPHRLVLSIWDNIGCRIRSEQEFLPSVPEPPTEPEEELEEEIIAEAFNLPTTEDSLQTRKRNYQATLESLQADKRYSRLKSLQQALDLMQGKQLSIEELSKEFSRINGVLSNTVKKKENKKDLIEVINALTHYYLDTIVQMEPKSVLEPGAEALTSAKRKWQATEVDVKGIIKTWKAKELEQNTQAPAIKQYLKILRKDG